MQSQNEVHAVAVAAGLINAAIMVLSMCGESIAVGIRMRLEKSLHVLGPDHVVTAVTPQQINGLIAQQRGQAIADELVPLPPAPEPPPVLEEPTPEDEPDEGAPPVQRRRPDRPRT